MLAVLMLEALLFKMFKYSTLEERMKIEGNLGGEERNV